MFFEITVSPKEKKPTESVERGYENSYSLLLAPFQPQTKIKLDCHVNKTVECNLTIINTNNVTLKTTITKVPPQERCLSLSGEEWSLEAKTNIVLNIKWEPRESGSWRDTIQLTDSRNIKYTVPLTLVCTDPSKKANSKLSKMKTKNYLGCKTNTKLHVPNSAKSVLSKTKSQPPVKRSISAACGVVDKENISNNLENRNCSQDQSITKKLKKNPESDFSKFLDSSAFKFTPIKTQITTSKSNRQGCLDINKADASWIFSQDPSVIADNKISTVLRKETYVTVPKFIHPETSPENVINDESINHINSSSPYKTKDVDKNPRTEISVLLSDIKFTPLKAECNKKINDDLQFSPNCCSTAQKPKKQSDSIDEKCKDDSDTRNATFNVNSVNNSDKSIFELSISPSVKKNNFNLKPVCLAETFENNTINIETSSVFPSNNYSTTNNLVTPIRCSNQFSKSQADFGSAKDCLEADLWVKSRNTSLSPVSKVFLHSTLDSISEENGAEDEDHIAMKVSHKVEKQQICQFEISPPKKHIFTKPTIRKVSPMKSSKIMKDKSVTETINYKKKVQISMKSGGNIKKPVGLIEKLSLQGLYKNADKCKSLKKQEVSVKLHDPNDFLALFCNPDLFGPTMTSDPFLASTHYYDDQWIFVQDLEFKKWLNALLSPPEHLTADVESAPIDVGKIWQSCRGKDNVGLAETREAISARYHTNSRLNILRKAAVSMYHKEDVINVLSKTTIAIEKGLIVIRDDKDLHRDIGLQKMILELFISYNPLWLRIGLEAIYGETIPLHSNNDIIGLSRFLINRFFSDPFIVKTHSSTVHPNIRLKTFQAVINKFMLKKFLFLVYFLDYSKRNLLIGHDPCLFHKKGKYKASREILLEFSKQLLSGIGDLTKVLKKYDYTVSHEQSFLDEYNYAVVNLCTDLKDGVRLCRVMELITGKRGLTSKCRVPAISLLQKIHNIDLALNALKEAGYLIKGNITARNIAEGHKEKTLSLLWQIIYKFQAPKFEKAATTLQKWWRGKLWYIRVRNFLRMRKHNAASVIQRSWKCFLARKKLKSLKENYNKQLEIKIRAAEKIQRFWKLKKEADKQREILHNRNLAALKIQRWWLRLKTTEPYVNELRNNYKLIKSMQERWRANQIMKHERNNYLKIRNIVIKIQVRWRAKLLCVREMKNYRKMKAVTIFIQNQWRAKCIMRKERKIFLRKLEALKLLQEWWRRCLIMKKDRSNFLALKNSVKIIEKNWIAKHTITKERETFLYMRNCTIIIQKIWRNHCATKNYILDFKQKQLSCVKIQSWWRAAVASKKYELYRSSCIKLQRWWRSVVLTRNERSKFISLKSSAIIIQKTWRMRKAFKIYRLQKESVLKIEVWWKNTVLTRTLKNEYRKMKDSVRILEDWWYALKISKKNKTDYLEMRKAIITLQQRWRAQREMKIKRREFLKMKDSALKIQSWYKMLQQKRLYNILKKRNSAALVLQARWLAFKTGQIVRKAFAQQICSIIFIQRRWRSILHMRKIRAMFLQKRKAAITIQKNWRSFSEVRKYRLKKNSVKIIENWRYNILLGRRIRAQFLELAIATIKLQNTWKAKQQLKLFRKQKNSVIIIQKNWRSYREFKNFQRKKKAAITIQRWVRHLNHGRKIRADFIHLKKNVVYLQRLWRTRLQMKEFRKKRAAAIVIQKNWKKVKAVRDYERQKIAVLFIENWRKHLLMGRQTRNEYLKLRSAAITMQKWFRVKLQVKDYQKQRTVIIKIQRVWRSILRVRECQMQFQKLKLATTVIQNRYRARKVGALVRKNYLIKVSSVIIIQRWWRNILNNRRIEILNKKKRWAVNVIENWFITVREQYRIRERERAELRRLHDLATKIQAAWRGFKVRQAACKKMTAVCKRVEDAAKAATPSATLAVRLQENIEIFKFASNIGQLSVCLASLDVITRLSPNACINVCQLNLVSKLYDILTKANRSLPWMDVCLKDISILLNLAKFDQTTDFVMREEFIEDLAKLLKISIDKKEDLFLHTATLMWILIQDDEYLMVVKNSAPAMYLLNSLYISNFKKLKSVSTAGKIKGEMLPSPKPDWGLKHKRPRCFVSVLQAITSISSRLKILNII